MSESEYVRGSYEAMIARLSALTDEAVELVTGSTQGRKSQWTT